MATKKKSDKKKVKPVNNSKPVVKRGRPSFEYSDELADEICKAISTSDIGLNHICKNTPHFPSPDVIYDWVLKIPTFGEKYARAREVQAVFLAEQILEIADDSSKDTMTIEGKNGLIEVEDKEWTNRSKLRVDARKWLASKFYSKRFGDKVDVTSGNEKISTAPVVVVATEEAKKLLDEL